jgi:hypothetical protein
MSMGKEARKRQQPTTPAKSIDKAAAQRWLAEAKRNAREFAWESNKAGTSTHKQNDSGGFLNLRTMKLRTVSVPTNRDAGKGVALWVGVDRLGRSWVRFSTGRGSGTWLSLGLYSLRKVDIGHAYDATPEQIREAFVDALATGISARRKRK